DGTGAFIPSLVPWVPTIMDRLDAAGLTWSIFVPPNADGAPSHGPWAICPSFADCLRSNQAWNMQVTGDLIDAARTGNLPAVSFATPGGQYSQHNGQSMAAGDNWIGRIVDAIMNGPQWGSTTVLLTWDDCGCFYDHVPPPKP